MAVSTQLFEMIDATVEGLGYELVDVEKLPRGLIRVTIDKDGGITLDDCEKVSNQLNNAMTVENVDYDRLEVSSPGWDRPFFSLSQMQAYIGQTIALRLISAVENRRKMTATLLEVTDQNITVDVEGHRLSIDGDNIDKANLIYQD